MRSKEKVARSGRLPNGTNVGLFGYDYDKIKKIRTIKELEAATVRLIFQLASEGVNTYQIAKRLNVQGIRTKMGCYWHPLGVRRDSQEPRLYRRPVLWRKPVQEGEQQQALGDLPSRK